MAKKTAEKAIRKSHNGANKRYSLKVQPIAAKSDLADYQDGVVDVALEEEARKRLVDVVEANGGVTELFKRGIRISLYHYRMPMQVVGAEEPLNSKEYRKANESSESTEESASALSPEELRDAELEEIAAEIAAETDEAKKAELIERASIIASAV